ncbi:MAG TPA: acyltransferase [Mucilaginibacter sp.]|nr:acyltransferase [Mucilaginibacter sp.]
MSMILNEKYVGHKSNFLFYTNRALKIYPIYWVILLLLIIWSVFAYKLGYWGTLNFYVGNWPLSISTIAYLAVANFFIIGLDWSFLFGLKNGNLYFTKNFNQTSPKVYNFAFNSIAWTISIELLFYVIAPFIVRRNLYLVLAFLFLSLMLRIVLALGGLSFPPWNYMFFPTQLMFFMGGIISYHLYLKMKGMNVNSFILKTLYTLLICIVLFYYQVFEESYIKQAVLYVSVILLMPASFIISKNNKFDRFLGNLSYPIYISQSLVINITAGKTFPKLFGWGFTSLVIILLVSLLLEQFVNKPIEKYRQRRMVSPVVV